MPCIWFEVFLNPDATVKQGIPTAFRITIKSAESHPLDAELKLSCKPNCLLFLVSPNDIVEQREIKGIDIPAYQQSLGISDSIVRYLTVNENAQVFEKHVLISIEISVKDRHNENELYNGEFKRLEPIKLRVK